MLDRQSGKIVFECDGCEETLDTETSDFSEARATLQGENWRTVNEGHETKPVWSHYCPRCRR